MAEVVNTSTMEWTGGGRGQARGDGTAYSHKKYLFKGDDSAPDNYEFTFFRSVSSTRFAPRHRHNFDQFRFAVKGPCNYSPDEDVREGQLGYFPEGAYYGPQRICDGAEFLSVQFGGASGLGFMSYAAWKRAYDELGKAGTFEKGVYRYLDSDGTQRNKDAWQALWEHTNNRPVTFPKPRIQSPMVVDPEAYQWIPEANQPGVSIKHFATYNERGTFSAMVRIGAGSSYRFESSPQTRLLYVFNGQGTVDAEPLEQECAVRIMKNSPASVFNTKIEMKILVFGLPRFD